MLIYQQGSDDALTACNLYFRKGVPDGAAFTENWYVKYKYNCIEWHK